VGTRPQRVRCAAPGSTLIKPRLEVAIVAIGAAALIWIGFASRPGAPRNVSVYSTYDSGPNGYRALYEVLRQAGVKVTRFERVPATLDRSISTLVVTGYENDPSRKPLDSKDAAALSSFVRNGGRLVAIDNDFAGPADVTPGAGFTLPAHGNGAIALARSAFTRSVTSVNGPVASAFPFSLRRGVPLLANQRGMVAIWYRFGRGEVIAITAPALFSNRRLRDAGNARFAYNVMAGHGDVAFDEYVHGYDQSLTLWGALPAPVHAAVWVVLSIALLALIGANVRFAPPRTVREPDERDSAGYIASLAELMRRSRRRPSNGAVVHQAVLDFRRRKEHA
jgi:hypothetical protein